MFIKLLTHWTEKRIQEGCSNWPQGFLRVLFLPLTDEKQQQNQAHSGKTKREKYCIWKLVIVLFRKTSVNFMNNPQIKQTGIKTHTIHPTKCVLLIQPAVQPSLKPWGSYSTKRLTCVRTPTHAHNHARYRTHTGNGFTILETRERHFSCCLENTTAIQTAQTEEISDFYSTE